MLLIPPLPDRLFAFGDAAFGSRTDLLVTSKKETRERCFDEAHSPWIVGIAIRKCPEHVNVVRENDFGLDRERPIASYLLHGAPIEIDCGCLAEYGSPFMRHEREEIGRTGLKYATVTHGALDVGLRADRRLQITSDNSGRANPTYVAGPLRWRKSAF